MTPSSPSPQAKLDEALRALVVARDALETAQLGLAKGRQEGGLSGPARARLEALAGCLLADRVRPAIVDLLGALATEGTREPVAGVESAA